MSKLFYAKIKHKSFSAVLVVVLVVSMLAAGFYGAGAGSIKAETAAAEVTASAAGESGYLNLTEEYTWEDQIVTTMTAQGTYTANFVYNDDPEPEEEDPDPEPEEEDPDPEPEEDPDPEPEEDPDPETEEDPDPVLSTINVSIEQDEKATGEVDVPDGATVEIGDQPDNGSATVEQDGSWEYIPDSGFSGEDQFTIFIEHADGTEEIITVELTVAEAQPEEDEDEDEETLPVSGGVVFASLIALWLFIAAMYSLRVGIIKR